jgi:hypothetical protein
MDEDFPGKVAGLCQQVYAWASAVEARLSPSTRYEKDQTQLLHTR